MPNIVHSAADLQTWASAVLGREQTAADTEAIISYVCGLPDRPSWGTDWTRFLEHLTCEQLLDVTQ